MLQHKSHLYKVNSTGDISIKYFAMTEHKLKQRLDNIPNIIPEN